MLAACLRGGVAALFLLSASSVLAAPFGMAPVGDETLRKTAGREDILSVAEARQTASVSRNSVSGQVTTGSIAMSDKAFQNLSGLAVINTNTGNNVAINSAMNVTITLSPR